MMKYSLYIRNKYIEMNVYITSEWLERIFRKLENNFTCLNCNSCKIDAYIYGNNCRFICCECNTYFSIQSSADYDRDCETNIFANIKTIK